MHNQPNPDDRLAQKGMVSRSIGHIADRRSLQMEPGIKHRPNVTRNGYAEQSNPFDALQNGAGNQPQAQTGEIAQEAKAWGNAQDMLTWARKTGR